MPQSKLHVVIRCYVHHSRAIAVGHLSRVATAHSVVNGFSTLLMLCKELMGRPTVTSNSSTLPKAARKQRWYAQLTLPQRQARQAAKETLVKFLTCNFGSDRLQFLLPPFFGNGESRLFFLRARKVSDKLVKRDRKANRDFFVFWTHLRISKEGHLGNPDWPFGTPRGGHCWLG